MIYFSHFWVSFRSDPYLNTDAGTMSPFEHGEVYVLDDGGEVEKLVSYYECFSFSATRSRYSVFDRIHEYL